MFWCYNVCVEVFVHWACSFQKFLCHSVLCGIWYHLYNLKNVKGAHGGVLKPVTLLWVFFTGAHPWVFFTFFKLYKWCQIAQSTSICSKYFSCYSAIQVLTCRGFITFLQYCKFTWKNCGLSFRSSRLEVFDRNFRKIHSWRFNKI